MSESIEQFKLGKWVLDITNDEDATSPREWDNFGHIICFVKRYDIGDEHKYDNASDFLQQLVEEVYPADKAEKIIIKADKAADRKIEEVRGMSWERAYHEELQIALEKAGVVMLPVYAHIHSGVTISTGAFNDRFDSGVAGWTYATRKEILDNWSAKRMTPKLKRQAIKLLVAEVKTLDDYLRGDVYGYSIDPDASLPEEERSKETGDSCWGFFGYDYCKSEALYALLTADDTIRDLADKYEIPERWYQSSQCYFEYMLDRADLEGDISPELLQEYQEVFHEYNKTCRKLKEEELKEAAEEL